MAQSQNEIKFLHYRRPSLEGVDPRGGMTIAYQTLEDGRIDWGYSLCSNRDNFERSTGRALAFNRLQSENKQHSLTKAPISEKAFQEEIGFEVMMLFGLLRKYSRNRKSKQA